VMEESTTQPEAAALLLERWIDENHPTRQCTRSKLAVLVAPRLRLPKDLDDPQTATEWVLPGELDHLETVGRHEGPPLGALVEMLAGIVNLWRQAADELVPR
jgi:hypothetical protein